MSDIPLLKEILAQILEGVGRIERRFEGVDSPGDFLADNEGIDRLDGIVTMLIAIGENLKNFERSGGKHLMSKHPNVDWKGAKGIRDFLSHHYFQVDVEVVHRVCRDELSGLKTAVVAMQRELQDETQL